MPVFFIYSCSCGQFSFVEGGDCWVDEGGHFGHALHPGYEPIGKPVGKWTRAFYDATICSGCGVQFTLVTGIHDWPLIPVQRPENEKRPIRLLKEDDITYFHDEQQDYYYHVYSIPCPDCGNALRGGSDILLHAWQRETVKRHGLPALPLDSTDAFTCPRCKAGEWAITSWFVA